MKTNCPVNEFDDLPIARLWTEEPQEPETRVNNAGNKTTEFWRELGFRALNLRAVAESKEETVRVSGCRVA